jgi:hypothetical protein
MQNSGIDTLVGSFASSGFRQSPSNKKVRFDRDFEISRLEEFSMRLTYNKTERGTPAGATIHAVAAALTQW